MSVLRAERRGGQGDHADPFDDPYEPPDSYWDGPDSGPHGRWPGDTDNDLSGR
jgi:hypothetical protein